MIDGLILLVFIGILVALLVVRARRRLGLASTGRMWMLIIVWAVVLGLVLWAAAQPSP
jgi:glucan phosphoethanolaminetransferase (alkaline phosphatase superfamily)